MADSLKELRDKLEGLTAGTTEYTSVLQQIRNREAAAKKSTDSAQTKADTEKAKKAAVKARAQEKKDRELLTTLEDYVQTRKDLGQSVPDKIQKQYNDLRVKYPKTETKPLGDFAMSTGANAAAVAESKAGAGKPKVITPSVDEQLTPPAKKTTPGVNSGVVGVGGAGGFTDSQNAARISKTGTKTATGAEDINAIYALARSKYGNVDSIFLYDDELKKLLIDAVGDPTTAKDDMDSDEFARRLGASDWAIRNGTTYAKRDAQRRQYDETLAKYNQQLELADTQDKKDAILSKIGQLKNTSSYAMGLASAKAYIEATASGLTGTLSPERLDSFVKRMYDSANDKDPNIINRELAALISYKPGNQLGGSVGADLTKLRATARANGFDLDTTFKDQINGWLQRLAIGESVDTFQNTIRSQAKLGLPDKVANLLDQGLDLSNIYAPYKNVMAAVLEVAPDSISLNDKTLRGAIGPEKEMSLYDFQRTLRKDSRWQYTDNARTEASDSVLKVLKDFGFQG